MAEHSFGADGSAAQADRRRDNLKSRLPLAPKRAHENAGLAAFHDCRDFKSFLMCVCLELWVL